MEVDLIKTHNMHVGNSETIKKLMKNIFYETKLWFIEGSMVFHSQPSFFFSCLPMCIEQKHSQVSRLGKAGDFTVPLRSRLEVHSGEHNSCSSAAGITARHTQFYHQRLRTSSANNSG